MNESPSPRPTKTVLGRGLGHLLGAERPRIEVPSRPGATQTKLPGVTPGVGALLRGNDARGDSRNDGRNNATEVDAMDAMDAVDAVEGKLLFLRLLCVRVFSARYGVSGSLRNSAVG